MSPCWDFISVNASAVCSSWCTLDTTTGQTCKHRTSRSGLVPGQQLYKPFHLDRLLDLNHIQGTSCSGQCLGVSDVCLYMCTQETCSKSFTDFLEHCCWVSLQTRCEPARLFFVFIPRACQKSCFLAREDPHGLCSYDMHTNTLKASLTTGY